MCPFTRWPPLRGMARWVAPGWHRDAVGVTGVALSKSTFRRILQNVAADALDDAVGA